MELHFEKTCTMLVLERYLLLNELINKGEKEVDIELLKNTLDLLINILEYIEMHDNVTNTNLTKILNGEQSMPIKKRHK